MGSVAQRIGEGQSRCVVELHDIERLFGCFKDQTVLFAVFGISKVVDVGRRLFLRDGAVIDMAAGSEGCLTGIVERMDDFHVADTAGHQLFALALTVDDIHLEFTLNDAVFVFDVDETRQKPVCNAAQTHPDGNKGDEQLACDRPCDNGNDRDGNEYADDHEQNPVAAVCTLGALFDAVFYIIAEFVVGVVLSLIDSLSHNEYLPLSVFSLYYTISALCLQLFFRFLTDDLQNTAAVPGIEYRRG